MNTKRLLEFGLDMSNPMNRLIRRAIIVGVLTAVSLFLTGYSEMNPAIAPIIAGFLAFLDKAIRMQKS